MRRVPRAYVRRGRRLNRRSGLDPNYAPAWAHLGWTKTLLIFGNHDPDLGREDLPQAIADIKHAIALDPMLASSWRALSLAIDSSKNPEEAVRAAERAIELGPGDRKGDFMEPHTPTALRRRGGKAALFRAGL
jgi:tetratricopeptide (TPR) repeat protein